MGTYREEIAGLNGTDFFKRAKREPHPRVRIRLLALGNLQHGKTKSEVVEMFQISFPTLRSWLKRFLSEGLEGLEEREGKGRHRKLSEAEEESFRQEVEALQGERLGGRVRARDIQVLLKEKFCVDYALPSVYHVLERCHLSWISARSKHPKTDRVEQEDFKKNFKKK